jgi:N6-adenosine-specific RNA methylase IME4
MSQKTEQYYIQQIIEKIKEILKQLHLDTFHKYRQAGLEIIASGYKQTKWKFAVQQRALQEWGIGRRTFYYMLELGDMTETEFCNVIAQFPSVFAWANQSKITIKPMPLGEFDIIYADPPWKYNIDFLTSSPNSHYPVLGTQEICQLQIPTSKNAVLFLWTTNPFLEDALQVMKTWGFEYKTNIVWVKDKFGTGFYVRGQHELLLIGTKGKAHPPEESNRFSSVVKAEVKEHSEKPEEIYKLIEAMYPDKAYLELFARKQRPNWKSWGNEA